MSSTMMHPAAAEDSAAALPGAVHSALYVGSVRHRRFAAPGHSFRHRLFMVYLDLAELPGLFRGRWLWSALADWRSRSALRPR